MKLFGFFAALLLIPGLLCTAAGAGEPGTRYLAFQIFTGGFNPRLMRQDEPPSAPQLRSRVDDLRARIFVRGPKTRKLGFILGPLSLDNTDEQVTSLIAAGFGIALRTDLAVGFHLDDSMFWGRLYKSLNRPGAVEWLDWSGRPNTGRRLDWASPPLRLMPQLCLNNKGVVDAVTARAQLVGREIAKGIGRLHAAGRDDLFIGVIAGWETQIGRDYRTASPLGYCAFTNAGFSADKPPADAGRAREDIVRNFIALWTDNIAAQGVPTDRIYSHTAFLSKTIFDLTQRLRPPRTPESYLEKVNSTPPEAAFGSSHAPGFSVYPEVGQLEDIDAALAKRGHPAWAAAKAVPIVPPEAGRIDLAVDMERFLANLYDHGARVVNIFGWGADGAGEKFRAQAEARASIAAYQKFLLGNRLRGAPLPMPEIPSADWEAKMQRIHRDMPGYITRNGLGKVRGLMDRLDAQSKDLKFLQAEKTADEILAILKE